MTDEHDSIADRASRGAASVEHQTNPEAVQVAVGGPCPDCGARVETAVHADTAEVRCPGCGHRSPVNAD